MDADGPQSRPAYPDFSEIGIEPAAEPADPRPRTRQRPVPTGGATGVAGAVPYETMSAGPVPNSRPGRAVAYCRVTMSEVWVEFDDFDHSPIRLPRVRLQRLPVGPGKNPRRNSASEDDNGPIGTTVEGQPEDYFRDLSGVQNPGELPELFLGKFLTRPAG